MKMAEKFNLTTHYRQKNDIYIQYIYFMLESGEAV